MPTTTNFIATSGLPEKMEKTKTVEQVKQLVLSTTIARHQRSSKREAEAVKRKVRQRSTRGTTDDSRHKFASDSRRRKAFKNVLFLSRWHVRRDSEHVTSYKSLSNVLTLICDRSNDDSAKRTNRRVRRVRPLCLRVSGLYALWPPLPPGGEGRGGRPRRIRPPFQKCYSRSSTTNIAIIRQLVKSSQLTQWPKRKCSKSLRSLNNDR